MYFLYISDVCHVPGPTDSVFPHHKRGEWRGQSTGIHRYIKVQNTIKYSLVGWRQQYWRLMKNMLESRSLASYISNATFIRDCTLKIPLDHTFSIWLEIQFIQSSSKIYLYRVLSVYCKTCSVCVVQMFHVLYKVCSMYCTRWQCVLYRVCSVYCTLRGYQHLALTKKTLISNII